LADSGELRNSAGSDRQNDNGAGEQARTAPIRRNNHHRNRARRSIGSKLGHGHRH